MSWLDSAIEQASSPIDVDVTHLKIADGDGLLEIIQVLPLSANEYQVLKSHPEMRKLNGSDDRIEKLGMLVTFEMMRKCDNSLSFKKFKELPLQLLNDLSTSILAASRGTGGQGDVDPLLD